MSGVRSSSRQAIEGLLFAYAERLDEGDLEGVADLFAHGVYRSDRGGEYRGAQAVLDMLRATVVLYDGTPRTKHVITNVVVEIDDERGTARARSYFTVFQATPALVLQPVIAGRYRDTFEREAGAWRFSERFIHVDLVGDLSQHVRRSLEP
jgi:3-phenylpropionate/cinnamic acid dioxygenase small subunit